MPFDDSNIRKLVRYQLEKKIHFSRSKPLSSECKHLILNLLEPDLNLRAKISQIKTNDWIKGRITSTTDISISSTNTSRLNLDRTSTRLNNYPLSIWN
jgi:serine kinase